MKNYSDITENLDITTKQYVDQGLTSKADVNDIPTSIDGLSGGTLTSPMTLTGGDGTAASKMILTSNGQITNESTATLFGRSGGVLIVGHQSTPLRLRGSATNPVYSNDNQTFKELAFKSDIPTIDTSNLAKLDTANTFTKGQTINGTVKGDWLQSGILGHVSSSTGKVCVFTANGTIYYRTPSEILSDAGGATLDELTAHINTVATQTTLGHIKMYVEGDTLYLNT